MTSGQGGPQDISDRVARGFEALVESEQAPASLARPPGVPSPPGSGGGTGGGGHATAAPAATVDAERLAALEEQVRQGVESLTDVVQARFAEAVDGLRDELETMRVDLQSLLNQATDDLAEERQELRTQIAKTVGAANKWFVKARDQLIERLDQIAAVAAEAEARAGEAVDAANAASAAAEAASTASSAAAAAAASVPPAPVAVAERPRAVELVTHDLDDGGDEVFEWDVEDDAAGGGGRVGGARRTPATVDLAVDGAELDALMDPVRGDIQELQGEVSAMGQAVAELRADVAALAKRVPARPKPVRIDERDIDVIIEAVLVAMTPPSPGSTAKKAPAKRATRPPIR